MLTVMGTGGFVHIVRRGGILGLGGEQMRPMRGGYIEFAQIPGVHTMLCRKVLLGIRVGVHSMFGWRVLRDQSRKLQRLPCRNLFAVRE